MYERIEELKESPCYQCGMKKECDKKVRKSLYFCEIRNNIFQMKNFDYKNCSLWIALYLENKNKKNRRRKNNAKVD